MSPSPRDSIRCLRRSARDRQRRRTRGGTVDTRTLAARLDHDRGIPATPRATLRPRPNAQTSDPAIGRLCDAVRKRPSRLDASAHPTHKEVSHAA